MGMGDRQRIVEALDHQRVGKRLADRPGMESGHPVALAQQTADAGLAEGDVAQA